MSDASPILDRSTKTENTMANVQNILSAAKKQKASGGPKKAAPEQTQLAERLVAANASELNEIYSKPSDGRVEGLDYIMYPNGEERKPYDASEELKEIQEGISYDAAAASKMPKAILQSVLSNPLDMPIPSDIDTKLMNEELQNRTVDIIGKLESRDGKKNPVTVTQTIYESAETGGYSETGSDSMAEISDRLARIEKLLAAQAKTPSMKMMRLGENSTIMFMDEDNNVYECRLVYKGKGRVRK